MFNILICGGTNSKFEYLKEVKQIGFKNFEKIHDLPSMEKGRFLFISVYIKGEIYVFGGYREGERYRSRAQSVDRYSFFTKTWKKVTDVPNKRQFFCACAFMDNIYLFGGRFYQHRNHNRYYVTRSCLLFDRNKFELKEVAKMHQAKTEAACAVFEENIVVSGGKLFIKSNTVELYDVFANTFIKMPNMIEARSEHKLVSVKSKLFAIGGNNNKTSCEVFDKTCNRFVKLKTPKFHPYRFEPVSTSSKMLLFQHETKIVLSYDVDKDKWSKESCEATEGIRFFSPVRVPSFQKTSIQLH